MERVEDRRWFGRLRRSRRRSAGSLRCCGRRKVGRVFAVSGEAGSTGRRASTDTWSSVAAQRRRCCPRPSYSPPGGAADNACSARSRLAHRARSGKTVSTGRRSSGPARSRQTRGRVESGDARPGAAGSPKAWSSGIRIEERRTVASGRPDSAARRRARTPLRCEPVRLICPGDLGGAWIAETRQPAAGPTISVTSKHRP